MILLRIVLVVLLVVSVESGMFIIVWFRKGNSIVIDKTIFIPFKVKFKNIENVYKYHYHTE